MDETMKTLLSKYLLVSRKKAICALCARPHDSPDSQQQFEANLQNSLEAHEGDDGLMNREELKALFERLLNLKSDVDAVERIRSKDLVELEAKVVEFTKSKKSCEKTISVLTEEVAGLRTEVDLMQKLKTKAVELSRIDREIKLLADEIERIKGDLMIEMPNNESESDLLNQQAECVTKMFP